MIRASSGIFFVAFLLMMIDLFSLMSGKIGTVNHVPFLWGFVFLIFGISMRIMERYAEKQKQRDPEMQTPIQRYMTDVEPENDDGQIPEHARGRAKTPDGLG